MHDALRLAGRAGGVGEEVRRLGVDLERGQHARLARRARTARARRARPTATSRSASSRIASIGTGLPRRDDSRCVITTFASLASSRCATAGAAKPGEDRHLDRAEVRDRVRGDGDLGRHRQEDRDAVARPDAERRRAARRGASRRARARRRSARGASRPRRGRRPRRASGRRAPSGGRSCARSRPSPPTNQVAHAGPARVVEHLRPRAARTRARGRRRERPEPLRLLDRAADELGVARSARRGATSRVAFACSTRRLVGASRRSRSRAQPYWRSRAVSVC